MGTSAQRTFVSSPEQPVPSLPIAAPPILPTLFREGYELYTPRKNTYVFSFLVHMLAMGLVILSARFLGVHRQEIRQQVVSLVTDIGQYALPPSKSKSGGGGGGGDRSKLAASKGALPRFATEQITPPAIVVRNESPKLAVPPTVVVPPEIKLPQLGPVGDPLAVVFAPSNGTGSGGGIGSGSGGGVGSGRGPGVGPGYGGGIGGGLYHPGGGVSAPRVIYSPDPEFSEEARKAKYQGVVVLSLIVGPDGRPHDVSVRRSLGMGLDEKAMEAIQLWKFEPGRKDGTPVAVIVNVEVNFHLY